MKKVIFMAMATVIMIAGCGRTGKVKKQEADKREVSVQSDPWVITPDETGIIVLAIKDGYAEASVRKEEKQSVLFSFDATGYSRISGRLDSADTMANIRFTQIFMPEGEADGPFGREIEYELPQKGIYKLSIGENMMAGDPWEGEFTIALRLTR